MNKSYNKFKKIISLVLIFTYSILFISGCSSGEGTEVSVEDNNSQKEEYTKEVVSIIDSSEAILTGKASLEKNRKGYTGSGYASIHKDEDSVTFNVSVEETGFYDLVFSAAADGYKENYVYVDGSATTNLVTETKIFSDCTVKRVYMESGSHKCTVKAFWGYTDIDSLSVYKSEPIDEAIYNVTPHLNNKKASKNTKRLMSYLCDNYGENILSGQYSQDGQFGKEFQVIYKETDMYPAVMGLDFIDYTPSRVKHGTVSNATQAGINYWNNGGIVTYCWHWNAPSKYITGIWYKAFYTDSTNIDIAKIMNGEDPEGYELLMEDIDAIAAELQKLEDADVPILWRPLHEASGGWFWWGAKGPDAYKKLYILLYDKLTNEYGLDNLIWVWNGQDPEWYPGDEYVDIIGWDIYPGEHEYGSQIGTYLDAVKCSETTKMVVLSENGCVPDADLCKRDGAMWGYIGTWGSEFVAKDTSLFAYSEQYTESDALRRFYENDIVISLENLPDISDYPIRKELK